MAGLGDVNVKLTLDDSSARATIKSFFADFGNQNIPDPLKGVDKSFERTAKAAKQLGYEWDAATQSFKNDAGFNANLQEMQGNIKNVKGAAKEAGKSFASFAKDIKKSDAEVLGFKGTSAAMAKSLKETSKAANEGIGKINSIGNASKNAGNAFGVLGKNATVLNTQLQGVGKGGAQGLTSIGDIATDTSGDLKSLATQSGLTSQAVNNLGKGGAQGVVKIGNDAQSTAKKVDALGDQAKETKSALENIGGGGAAGLQNIATSATTAKTAFSSATTSAKAFGNSLSTTAKAGAPLGTLAKSIQSVGTAGKNATAPTTTLTRALDQAAKTAQPLRAVPPAIAGITAAANTAKGATKGMADELQKAGKESTTFSQAVQQGFTQILQGIPQGIGIAIGNALIAPLKLAADIIPTAVARYRELDEVLRLTLAIAGEGAENFGRLSAAVKQVGAASAATNVEVGQVAQALARAGFSLDEIEASLAGVVQGAEATGMSYAEMGDIVVSALGQFQMGAERTTEAVDSMVVAANSSNQTVSDLGQALKYVGPVANTVGQSLDETNVQLALLANSGIRASTAGTSLRTILTNLQIAAGGAGEEFTELSRGSGRLQATLRLIGADMTDTNGELKTGTDLIYALQDSMKSLNAGERAIVSKVLAGSEGLPALSAIINATGDDIEALAEKMNNKLGAAANTQQTAMEGLDGSLKKFNSNLETLLTSVGELAAKIFTPIVDGATAVLSAFNSLPGPIQTVLITLTALAAGVAAVKLAMQALKVEIVATFAANTVAMIQKFAAAFTSGNISSAILNIATQAGALATTLKGALVAGIAGTTKALNTMTTALQAANAQMSLKNIQESISNLKNFSKTVKEGIKNVTSKEGALGKLTTAFQKGAKGSQPMTQQLSLFDGITKTATAGLGKTAGAATAAGTALGGAAAPAAAAGTATATAGTAAAGAGVGFGSLVGAIGSFLVAAAPIAAIVGAIVLVFKSWATYTDAYNKTAKELSRDTNKLNDVLDSNKDSAAATEEANKSWFDSMHEGLGPLSGVLKLLPTVNLLLNVVVTTLQKVTEGFTLFFGMLADNGKIDALRDSFSELEQSLGRAEAKMKANREAMAGLSMESEEYRDLLAENIRIQQGVVDATQGRIDKLKAELKTLDENGEGNNRVAQAIKKQIAELEGGLPAQQARLQNLKDEMSIADDLAGTNTQLTTSYQGVMRARNDAYGAIDTKVAQDELTIMAAVRQGLLSETEARAVAAKGAVEAANQKLAADEKALKELQNLHAEGKISETKFLELKQEITSKVKADLENRMESEKALTEATASAINERLDAYAQEQQTIAANVQAINTSLGELGQINSGAITAFKSLSDASTNYELAGLEKVKEARLKTIDATYKEGAKKEAAKQRVERDFEKEKKRILQEQQTFNEQAQRATFAAKQAELQLWYAQQTVQNQLAQAEADIAIQRAIANGASQEEITQLENVKRLTEFQGELLQDQLGLKRELLGIENQAAQAGLAAKARADGTRSAFAGSVANVSTLAGQMDAFQGKIQAVADKTVDFQSTLGEVGTVTAKEVADSVRDKINAGLGAIDTTQAENALKGLGVPPEIARGIAEDMTGAILSGTASGVDQAKMKVVEVFGAQGFVPKQLIEDQLIGAFQSGGQLSVTAAKNEFDKLPDALPFDRIAEVLGQGLGGGAEAGQQALNALTLDQTTVDKITEAGRKGLESGGDKGAEAFNNAVEKSAPKLEQAVSDGVGRGLGKAETEVNEWSERVGSTVQTALVQAGNDIGVGFQAELDKVLVELQETLSGLANYVDAEAISKKIAIALLDPIREAQTLLDQLVGPEDLGAGAAGLADEFKNAVNSKLGQETKTVYDNARRARGEVSKLPSAMSSAARNAANYARELERAARAARDSARYKFAGGPVSPGQTYTVNEFGREMFQSSSGRISEIKVPSFGQWTPPSSGTVIPAHIANQIRDSRDQVKIAGAMTSAGNAGVTKINVQQASKDSTHLQRALVRELQKLDGGGPVSNQITIQSQAPVNDASRMLAEMNRLRAYRR